MPIMNTMRLSLLAAVVACGTLQLPTAAKAEEIYMIRGAMNVFSAGMNQMTKKLQSRGLRARSMSNGEWSAVARDIISRSKRGKVSYPIIIAGHSVGGQEAPRFADTLAKAGIPVKLVIGIDPGWAPPPPFTAGSPKVVNFWVGGSTRGNPYKARGTFKGSIRNVDIRSFSKADHVGIDKDPAVQKRIIGLILAAM